MTAVCRTLGADGGNAPQRLPFWSGWLPQGRAQRRGAESDPAHAARALRPSHAGPDNLLDIAGLTFGYGAAEPVLDNVDLRVRRGEFVSLIGPSGCGKSTLLRIVMGLARARSGAITLNMDRRDVGFLFQSNALLPWRTARDNVALGLRARGQARKAARVAADGWLASLGLEGLGGRYPRELSGGQCKRVAIAQVLALKPRLLLMDEPFASLDAIVRRYITEDLLARVEDAQTTVLMVTHDLEEAVSVSDRIALMSNGPHARVKAMFDVPFGRPRDLEHVRVRVDYAALVARLWGSLSEEIHIPRNPRERHAAARAT